MSLCSWRILLSSVRSRTVTSGQLSSRVSPPRFFVDSVVSEGAQRPDRASVNAHGGGRDSRAGWLGPERHELVGKSRHSAADTDATDVGTTAHPVHPSPLGHVAVHHRAPTAQ